MNFGDLMSAFNAIKPDLKNIDMNNKEQVMALLTRKGWKPNMVSEFLNWLQTKALPVAKTAKMFGIDPVKKFTGIDIDSLDIEKAKSDIENAIAPKYPSYDQRSNPEFQETGIGYGVRNNRADKYPDI